MDFVVVGYGWEEITLWNYKPKISFPKNFCQIDSCHTNENLTEVYTQKNWKAGLQDSVIHISSSQITYNLTDRWTNCVWYIQQWTNTHS